MPNVRPMNEKKYEISKHRFLELYHFCMQYQEWENKLKYEKDTVKGMGNMDGIHGSGGMGSATEQLVIRRMRLREKCELIEQTAIEADSELYPYIIEGVTKEYASYKYLKQAKGIPCGKDMYYNRRRKFYWLLAQRV
ncbi:MAG: hypothetical protein HFH13_04435 [Dorea sp.]|nr:hypothetical protein [Dorea sp.]